MFIKYFVLTKNKTKFQYKSNKKPKHIVQMIIHLKKKIQYEKNLLFIFKIS